MKYIRTKDGVYEVFPNQEEDEVINSDLGQFMKGEVLNQADTIEELCDELVVIDITGTHYAAFDLESAKHYVSVIGTYGAIWTDKGLIYVAKLNDKGELELK